MDDIMQYKLKLRQPNFEIVDGPGTGLKFVAGKEYDNVPEAYRNRFDKVRTKPAAPPAPKPVSKSSSKKDEKKAGDTK